MAYLVENADGKAITGKGRVLDIQPEAIHERRPIFLGSAEDVEIVEKLYLSWYNEESSILSFLGNLLLKDLWSVKWCLDASYIMILSQAL